MFLLNKSISYRDSYRLDRPFTSHSDNTIISYYLFWLFCLISYYILISLSNYTPLPPPSDYNNIWHNLQYNPIQPSTYHILYYTIPVQRLQIRSRDTPGED